MQSLDNTISPDSTLLEPISEHITLLRPTIFYFSAVDCECLDEDESDPDSRQFILSSDRNMLFECVNLCYFTVMNTEALSSNMLPQIKVEPEEEEAGTL